MPSTAKTGDVKTRVYRTWRYGWMEVRMDGGTDGWRYGWMELIIKGQTCILYCMQMSVIYVPTTLAQVKNCPSVFYNQRIYTWATKNCTSINCTMLLWNASGTIIANRNISVWRGLTVLQDQSSSNIPNMNNLGSYLRLGSGLAPYNLWCHGFTPVTAAYTFTVELPSAAISWLQSRYSLPLLMEGAD